MRVLKTTQTYLPYLDKGGPPVKVSGIARALAQRGIDVSVLTADLGETNGHGPYPNWQRATSKWGWESRYEGVDITYLPTITSYRATTLNPRVLSFCSQRLSEYDLVHVYGLYDMVGSAVAWSCRRRSIPYVLEPLGMFGPKIRSRRKKQLYSQLVGNALFDGAAKVIATSETEQQELIDGGIEPAKIVLRRNGLDLNDFQNLPLPGVFRAKLNLASDQKLVLFVGRLSFIKGLDLLVEAFAGIESTATLVLAGPDDDDGCLKKIYELKNELKLNGRVIHLGPLYGTEKLEAMVDADFFVLPSRYESFGNAAAEAIACGLPVLVTNECGIAPLVECQAGLVVPCDVDGLREGLRRMLEDEQLRARLAAGTAAVGQSLSWDEPVRIMEAVYEEVVMSDE